MAGIKEMRDELLGLLDRAAGISGPIGLSYHARIPLSRFPGELSFLSGLFGVLALEGSRAGWRCLACHAASNSSGERPTSPCGMRRGFCHPSM